MGPYRTPTPCPKPAPPEPDPLADVGTFSIQALVDLGTYWADFFRRLEGPSEDGGA